MKILFWLLILALLGWGFWKYQQRILPYFSKALYYVRTYAKKEPVVKIVRETPQGGSAEKLAQELTVLVKGLPPELEIKSEAAPEIIQELDLNGDGIEEIIADLNDYGAYTDSFGVLEFKNGKLAWVILREADGSTRPAIFRDGSSAKHANIFKIFEKEPKALVQIFGDESLDGRWSWEVEAYSWNGRDYVYDAALSEKILKDQPKRFQNGEPVF